MENNGFKTLKIKEEILRISLIGCGGTGSFLSDLLCRMIKGFRLATEFELWDPDCVKDENVARQQFLPCEVGKNKAEALALRLGGQFGLSINAHPRRFGKQWIANNQLIITATDTLSSRRTIAKTRYSHWIDVGNELTHGQAIYGNTHASMKLKQSWTRFYLPSGLFLLPSAAALNPALLKGKEKRKKHLGCAEMPFARQGFGVNVFAASAAALLAKQVLVDRAVVYHAVYFNLETGWMRPRRIDRELFRQWK